MPELNLQVPQTTRDLKFKLFVVVAEEHEKAVEASIKRHRGMLDDTIVVWAGEFGRTPFSQGSNGRDHNPFGFSVWMAGGGFKGGTIYGATDELGYQPVKDPVHLHDLNATILHLLGLDHEQLTYKYQGRDFRLTDVAGHVMDRILA